MSQTDRVGPVSTSTLQSRERLAGEATSLPEMTQMSKREEGGGRRLVSNLLGMKALWCCLLIFVMAHVKFCQ